jgi:DNA-binding LacI/PurR family transcriptional regulator
VKSVVQVGVRDFDDVRTALRKAGIDCKSWLIDEPSPGQTSNAYAELARDAFVEYLKSGKPLPDAFYFSDDYLCAGALATLSDVGIRAPQDVRIVTWANHGNAPIYARELSRIELNPWKDAEDTYAFCRSILSGKTPGNHPILVPEWIEGGTF